MPKRKKQVSRVSMSMGEWSIERDGKIVAGGGGSYQRIEYADGTVKEESTPMTPRSASDVLGALADAMGKKGRK